MWKSARDAFGPGNPLSHSDFGIPSCAPFTGSHHLFQLTQMTGPGMLFPGQPRPLCLLLSRKVSELKHPSKCTPPGREGSCPAAVCRLLFLPFPDHPHPLQHPWCWSFISALPLSWHPLPHHAGCDILECFRAKCLIPPVALFLPGAALQPLNRRVSLFPREGMFSFARTSLCTDACDVVAALGRAAGAGRLPGLTLPWYFLSLVEFVSCYLCWLGKVCILSKHFLLPCCFSDARHRATWGQNRRLTG